MQSPLSWRSALSSRPSTRASLNCSWLALALSVAGSCLVACGGIVAGELDPSSNKNTPSQCGGDCSSSDARADGAQEETAGHLPVEPSGKPVVLANAISGAQLGSLWDKYWNDAGKPEAAGDHDFDPDALYLQLSDLGVTCSSPVVDLPCGEGAHWHASLLLSPEQQTPGVYRLNPPGVLAQLSEVGSPYSTLPEDCPRSAGGFWNSNDEIEILEIDATHVRFRLTSQSASLAGEFSGVYTALRCP